MLALLVLLGAADPNETFLPPAEKVRVRAVQVMEPPVIDGVLDDEVWWSTKPTAGFREIEPIQREPATYDTEVRVAWDEKALYFAIRSYEPDAKHVVRTPSVQRDFNGFEHDNITVLLDTLGDERNATAFQVNAAGAMADYLAFDDADYDLNWDAVWRCKTGFEPTAWVVEIAIPWSSLRYKPSATHFGLQVFRRARARNEYTALSPFPRAYGQARMSYAGRLEGFIAPSKNALSLLLRPFATFTGDVGSTPAPALVGGQVGAVHLGGNIGGDVRLSPSPGLIVEATANTDFSETDVDRRVINLSRSDVYFPERRQFFLESATLLSPGYASDGNEGQLLYPFFSRRIGLTDDGRRIPMTFGTRTLLRTGDDNAAAMFVHTADGADESAFGLVRYSRNIGEQSRVGALTVLRYDTTRESSNMNVVPAVDGLYRKGTFSADAMATFSYNDHPEKSGLPIAGYVRVSDNHPTRSLSLDIVAAGPGYDPRTGFLGREDFVNFRPSAGFDLRPSWRPKGVRSLRVNAQLQVFTTASDFAFRQGVLYVEPMTVIFDAGHELGVWAQPEWQRLTEAFAPVDDVSFDPGDYRFASAGAYFNSDPSRRFSFTSNVATGKYYSANWSYAEQGVRFSPIANISLRLTYQLNVFTGLQNRAGEMALAHLVQAEARLALNPKLQMIGFMQWASRHDQGLGINARIQWEYWPLSFLYAVYTASHNDHRVVLKLVYTFQS